EAQAPDSIEGVPPLAPARRLCAALRAAEAADALLGRAKGQAETFPEDVAAFTRTSSDALALTRARLGDVELQLRRAEPGARLCGQVGIERFLAEAADKRLANYQKLLSDRPALSDLFRRRAA